MKIKTKKKNKDGIVRLETSGEIKEILINEDFLSPRSSSIAICFKGKDSSGIIELTPREFEVINKEIGSKIHLLKGIKVLRFQKEK